MTESALRLRNQLNQPFWDGAEQGHLVLPRCAQSDRFFWPPSPTSPYSGGPVEWSKCEPVGTIASVVVYRRVFQAAFADLVPYGIALVALDCGVRLLAHVIAPDEPGAPRAGARVIVGFQKLLADGPPLPVVRANPD